MSDELDLMAVGDLMNAAFQRLHDKTERLESELETAKMERLVADHELAAANAKIEAVRAFHIESVACEGVCIHCEWSWPCRTIRALESATPQGSLAGSTIQAKDDQC